MERTYPIDSNLVLRTVYLPRDLDDWLRREAFEQHKSKNEIIRSYLLEAWEISRERKVAAASAGSVGTA